VTNPSRIVSSPFVPSLDAQSLLDRIVVYAVHAFPSAVRGALYLFDPHTGDVRNQASYGFDEDYPAERLMPVLQGTAGRAIQERKPILLNLTELSTDTSSTELMILPHSGDAQAHSQGSFTAMVVPLVYENRSLGALFLESAFPGTFSEADLQLLGVFASTATASIQNALMTAEVQQLTILDALTGLYNRLGFFHLARREVERAWRHQRLLTAVMIDLDNFRRINDQYGREGGDLMLRRVSDNFRKIVRTVDLVCRYDGEEFAVLLPETNLEQAEGVADRLRASVALLNTSELVRELVDALGPGRRQARPGSLTCSLGIAVLEMGPEKDAQKGLERLLEHAQQAMNISRLSGGNRVTIWDRLEKELGLGQTAALNTLVERLQRREHELRWLRSYRMGAQEYLVNILQSTSQAIISFDDQHKIMMFNKRAEEMFGYQFREVWGDSLEIILPGQAHLLGRAFLPLNVSEDALALQAQQILIARRKNGLQFPIEINQTRFQMNGQMISTVMLADMTEKMQAEERVLHANQELSEAYDSTIESWAKVLELRDLETHGHSKRVVELSLALSRELDIQSPDMVHIRRGALLHDIGKLAIPDTILLKPGPLTHDEWAVIKKHPTIAFDLLSPLNFLHPALDIPRFHHERWDGTGYPFRLRAEEIPLPARIFAVVDVWDALRSDRPYSRAWSNEEARSKIQEESGRQFDPRVVEAFFSIVPS